LANAPEAHHHPMVRDAETLAQRGYVPVGQSWGDGRWDGGYFLI